MVDCGAGGSVGGEVTGWSEAPSGWLAKLARTFCANCTAPSTLSWPAPCSKVLKPASGCAVYIRIALTRLGVSALLARMTIAAAAATTGADMLVPERYIIFGEEFLT